MCVNWWVLGVRPKGNELLAKLGKLNYFFKWYWHWHNWLCFPPPPPPPPPNAVRSAGKWCDKISKLHKIKSVVDIQEELSQEANEFQGQTEQIFKWYADTEAHLKPTVRWSLTEWVFGCTTPKQNAKCFVRDGKRDGQTWLLEVLRCTFLKGSSNSTSRNTYIVQLFNGAVAPDNTHLASVSPHCLPLSLSSEVSGQC